VSKKTESFRDYGSEYFDDDFWYPTGLTPSWCLDTIYRIKPETKPDIVMYSEADIYSSGVLSREIWISDNLKLKFDGETKVLKSAEVIK